ncbi:MAG: 2-hydroxymuconate tautomerase family protein [Rhodospirillales bacterium]|nr:2-hydroxymuconate tautomerase family protein [Rhodospirillales bacterium]
MPVITLKMGKAESETKRELIEKLTTAAAEVTNMPASSYTVFIEELELDNIGVGGHACAERAAAK